MSIVTGPLTVNHCILAKLCVKFSYFFFTFLVMDMNFVLNNEKDLLNNLPSQCMKDVMRNKQILVSEGN